MKEIRKILHLVLGVLLLVIGVAGLVLPIVNGTIFILLGLILISFESKYVDYHVTKLAHKTLFTGRWYETLNRFMKKVFGK